MGMEAIGKNIAMLRKEKGATQEQLAKYVGISPQAVSKWENGGVPDTELLGKIADYFETSVDALFGRNIEDDDGIENAVVKKMLKLPADQRFAAAMEFCWILQQSVFGIRPVSSLEEYCRSFGKEGQRYSSVRDDAGYSLMGVGNQMTYFFLTQEIEDKQQALLEDVDYVGMFRDLSDKAVFDSLVLLNQREQDKAFTPNLLVKNLGITFEKAQDVIEIIKKYGLIRTIVIEMDDSAQEVYSFQPDPSFCALLTFAREMITQPNTYAFFSNRRTRPYLK